MVGQQAERHDLSCLGPSGPFLVLNRRALQLRGHYGRGHESEPSAPCLSVAVPHQPLAPATVLRILQHLLSPAPLQGPWACTVCPHHCPYHCQLVSLLPSSLSLYNTTQHFSCTGFCLCLTGANHIPSRTSVLMLPRDWFLLSVQGSAWIPLWGLLGGGGGGQPTPSPLCAAAVLF